MSSTSPNFESMTSTLASIIETTMVSLYDLQTSLINAHGWHGIYPSPHQLISKIRPRFKRLWEDIRAFLQMSHGFGGDIIILQESLGRESEADCMEFLIAIGERSTQLFELAKTLTSDAIKLREGFSSLVPEFENTLRNSRTRINRTDFGEYESEWLAQEARPLYSGDHPQCYARQWIERPVVVERSKVDKETQAFVEASIAAIHPDGQKSLDVTTNALDKMILMLTQFIQYWQSSTKSCQLFILHGSINIKPKTAQRLASEWRANRAALEGATLGIAKSCDAVLVDAVGVRESPAPLPPPVPRRPARLVKAIREPTPSPPPLPPRKDSHSRDQGNLSYTTELKRFFGYAD